MVMWPWKIGPSFLVVYAKSLEIEICETLGKVGGRTIMKTRLNLSWNSWILDQFLLENMKWKLQRGLKHFTKPENHQNRCIPIGSIVVFAFFVNYWLIIN